MNPFRTLSISVTDTDKPKSDFQEKRKNNGKTITSSKKNVCYIDGDNIVLSSLNSISVLNVNSEEENDYSDGKGSMKKKKENTCNIHCSSDYKKQIDLVLRLQLELKRLKVVTMSTAEFCQAAGQCGQVPQFLVTPTSALHWEALPESVKVRQSFDLGWLYELTMKGTLLGMGVAPFKKSARCVKHVLCSIY